MESTAEFKKCSVCKKSLIFGQKYYLCSVSTCNSLRTGLSFCSVACFERHLPGARHRDAAAIETMAPQRRVAPSSTQSTTSSATVSPKSPSSNEVLVIASRLKDYITAKSGYNTSQAVMDVVSDHIRNLCDRAIDEARADGRKTVMDRDFEFLKKL